MLVDDCGPEVAAGVQVRADRELVLDDVEHGSDDEAEELLAVLTHDDLQRGVRADLVVGAVVVGQAQQRQDDPAILHDLVLPDGLDA